MLDIEPLVFSDPLIAIAVCIIVFVGAVVQAGLGMGFGLTVAPVLALIDPALVPASALFLGMATSLMGAVSDRKNIVWSEVGLGVAGRTMGILVGGAMLLVLLDRQTFSLVFGIIILGAVLLSVAGWRLSMNLTNLLSMSFVSGFTGIFTSVGAPPMALIYQGRDPLKSRATLAAFFAFGCAFSLIFLYASGWAGIEDFWGAMFMVPAALFGTWTGRRWRGRFDKRYRGWLLSIAALASVLLIIRGLA